MCIDVKHTRLKYVYCSKDIVSAQDDDSGARIPQDPSGKMLETHRILQENTGNGWKMEAVFRSKTARIL